ncbi:MAG: outer membrane protein [Methylocystis sp.]
MKKALSVAALALAMTGSALAADLPHYKAPPPPPPPPPPMWTGFYVGLNAGGTWSNSNTFGISTFAPSPFVPLTPFGVSAFNNLVVLGNGILPINNSGFIGGGQIGYNWQFYNSFVAGVEADIQGIASSNSTASAWLAAPTTLAGGPSVVGLSATKSLDYLGTVRGRLGWLFTPTLLVYGTGGLAYGGVRSSASIASFASLAGVGAPYPAFSNGAYSDTRVGWTAGGGLEWMFWPNWSAKVEYLYYDLGSVNYSAGVRVTTELGTAVWGNISQASTRYNGNIVRAGVNYHFNWGAPPVVAKY